MRNKFFKNGHSATLAKDGGNPLCCVSSFERGSTTWRRLFDQLANYLKKKINFKNLAVALWPTPPTPSKFSSQSNFFRPSLNRWRQFPLERVIILLLDNASLHCQSNYSASKYIWNSTQPRKQTAAQYPYQIWRWHGEQIYTLRQVLETLTISDWRDLAFLHRFIQALPSNIVFHIIQFGVLVWLLYTSASFRNPKYT